MKEPDLLAPRQQDRADAAQPRAAPARHVRLARPPLLRRVDGRSALPAVAFSCTVFARRAVRLFLLRSSVVDGGHEEEEPYSRRDQRGGRGSRLGNAVQTGKPSLSTSLSPSLTYMGRSGSAGTS